MSRRRPGFSDDYVPEKQPYPKTGAKNISLVNMLIHIYIFCASFILFVLLLIANGFGHVFQDPDAD